MPIPHLPKSGTPTTFKSSSVWGAVVNGTAGNDQLTARDGRIALVGGDGDDTYYSHLAGSRVVEQPGQGIDTVIATKTGYVLRANVENLTLTGVAKYAVGNAGDNILAGQARDNWFTTGGGTDVITGGGGADVYNFTRAAGSVTWITDFGSDDRLVLAPHGFHSLAEVQARMSQVGPDLKIDLGGQTVMLANRTASAVTSANVVLDPSRGARHLTFADDFDGPLSLNTGAAGTKGNTWKTTFYGGERRLVGNNDQQYYVDPDFKGSKGSPLGLNPFSVSDGVLDIHAAPTPSWAKPYLYGMKYTSGLLTTQTSFQQQYGYFEIRAQDPAGKGLFPAFWLLAPGQWPPEIDVYEQIGSARSYVSHGAISSAGPTQVKGLYITDMTKGFHTYAIDWNAQHVTWFVDGKQTFQIDTPADMHKPMYVLLNLAVGGNWPGNPDSTTDWSKSHLLVDYVHIYSNPGAGGSTPGPTPSPIPKPIPTPTPGARTDLSVGNAENPLDPAGAVDIAVTGANTLTTYKIPMFNVTNKVATVTAAFDGHDKLILINASAWNAVKNAIVTFAPGNGATIRNFVDVELTSGGANDTVNIVGMKRGTIATGGGDDSLAITGFSNSHRNNLSKVLAGLGDDAINYTGGGLNKILLDGGDGGDRITAAGRSTGTVLGGRGNDTLAIHSTGEIKLTGGSGADAFVFGKNADATVTDFVAGVDHVQLIGVGLANVHTSWAGADTLIDLGGGGSIRLAGVHLTKAQIDLHLV